MTRIRIAMFVGVCLSACSGDRVVGVDPQAAEVTQASAVSEVTDTVVTLQTEATFDATTGPETSSAVGATALPDVTGSFRFLPPIGPEAPYTEMFDPAVYPSLMVSVCRLSGSDCAGAPVSGFAPGNGVGAIRLDTEFQSFIANWKPKDVRAKAGDRYLVSITAAGLPLGAVGVFVAAMKNSGGGAEPGDILVNERETLPVVFQVDLNPRIRAWTLRADGLEAADAADRLTSEFGLGATETVRVLIDVGYSPVEVGTALRDALGLGATGVASALVDGGATVGAEDTAGVLVQVGFSASEIAGSLVTVFGQDGAEVAALLMSLGFDGTQTAQALVDALGSSPAEVAQMLGSLSLPASDVAVALTSVFGLDAAQVVGHLQTVGYSAAEIGEALATAFGLDPDGAAAALVTAGWSAPDIAALLKDAFELGLVEAIDALRTAGFSLPEVAEAAQGAYGVTESELVAALVESKYSIGDVAGWLQTTVGKTEKQTIQAFKAASIPAGDVAAWLVGALGHSYESAAIILRVGGYLVTEVGGWLATIDGFTVDIVVQTLRAAGFAASPVADWLKDVLERTPEQAVTHLEQGGFDAAAAMGWLKDTLGLGAQAAADIARGSGYDATDVTDGLQGAFTVTADDATAILNAIGFEAGASGTALEEVYGLSEAEVVTALDAGGFPLEDVTDWLIVAKEKTLEEAVGVLQQGGIVAGRVAGVLKDVYSSPKEFVFNVFAAVGYGFGQTASAIKEHFEEGIVEWLVDAGLGLPDSFSLADVAEWGMDVGSLTLDRVIQLMEGKGIPAGAVVDWLTTELPGTGAALAADIAGYLNDAGYTLTEIAAGLQSFGIETAAEGLRLAEFAANEVASALEAAYGLAEDRVVAAMDAAGFALEQTLGWLQDVKGRSLEDAAAVLREGGIVASRMADMLIVILKSPKEFAFNLMTAIGYGFRETADNIVRHFGSGIVEWLVGAGLDLPERFTLAEVAEWGLHVGGVTIERVIQLMEGKGIPAGDVVDWLTTQLTETGPELASRVVDLLKQANFTAHQIADGMTAFGAEATAKAMKVAGFTVTQVGDAISGVWGFTVEATSRVLRVAGWGVHEVAGYVKHVLGTITPIVLSVVLKAAGFVADDVADVLKELTGLTGEAAAVVLKGAGYGADKVAGALKNIFEFGIHEAAAALGGAGFTVKQIARQLIDVWGATLSQVADALYAAGASVLDIAQVLKDLGQDLVQVATILAAITGSTFDAIWAIIASLWL